MHMQPLGTMKSAKKNNVSVHIRERDFSPATSGNELHGVLHPSSNMQVFCHSINLSAYLGARKARAQQNCTEINQSMAALICHRKRRGTQALWDQIVAVWLPRM